MIDQPPLHRMFHHYSEMPYSQRVLFTATARDLGLGYLFALTLIFFTYAGLAGGNPWLLPTRISSSPIPAADGIAPRRSALSGPMRDHAAA